MRIFGTECRLDDRKENENAPTGAAMFVPPRCQAASVVGGAGYHTPRQTNRLHDGRSGQVGVAPRHDGKSSRKGVRT